MASETRPNVVLIMTDDLNDYTTELGGHPQAKTPNLTRLAETGVSFHSAYASNPICSPSRSSFFSGLHCHTSGHFYFDPWFHNETLVNTKMIPEHFGDNGYRTMGTGKLLHHLRRELWEDYGHRDNYGPFAFNGNEPVAHPSVPEPFRSIGFVDGGFGPLSDVPVVPATDDAPGAAGWYDKPQWDVNRPLRYVSEDDRDPTPDERCTQWAVEQIEALSTQPQDRPFFLGVGYIRPHTPLHAPKRFFDMFRIDDIELPVTLDGDADDTHYLDVFPDSRKGPMHFRALMESYPTRKEALRAYGVPGLRRLCRRGDRQGHLCHRPQPLPRQHDRRHDKRQRLQHGGEGLPVQGCPVGGERPGAVDRPSAGLGTEGRRSGPSRLAGRHLPDACRPLWS